MFGKLFRDGCSKVQGNVDEVAVLGRQEHLPVSAGLLLTDIAGCISRRSFCQGRLCIQQPAVRTRDLCCITACFKSNSGIILFS